jgi:hypothetical protein
VRQHVAGSGHGHLGPGRLGVLGHVGQRLGDDEVGHRLDAGRGGARHVHPQPDRQRGARREPGQGRGQAPVAEHGRVQTADELAQLGQGQHGLVVRRGDGQADGLGLGVEALPGHAEGHGQ